jgi:hypothetical protein
MCPILKNSITSGNVNLAPAAIQSNRAPLSSDNLYEIGACWVDETTNTVYTLTSFVNGAPTWTPSTPSGSGSFSSISVSPGPSAFSGEFRVLGNVNEANVIRLEENAGAAGTITIESLQGTGAASIGISSGSGGIEVTTAANAPAGNMIVATDGGGTLQLGSTGNTGTNDLLVNLNGGTSSKLLIANQTGTAATSIEMNAVAGGMLLQTVAATSTLELNAELSPVVINGNAGAATDITLNATTAGGGVTINSDIGGFNVDTTGSFAVTSNGFTDTSTGQIILTSSDAAANAIELVASGSGGGIQIGQTATTASVAISNIVPSVNRTNTLSGGTIASNIADTLNLGTGATSTNAGAIKTVNIATGTNLLGTNTVNIATGTSATGVQAINIGGTDFLTANTIRGATNLNAGSSTAATTIGNATNGGAVGIASLAAITINSAGTTGSDVVIEATGAGGGIKIAPTATTASIGVGNVIPTVSRTTTINGGAVSTAVTDLVSIADGGVSTSGSAEKEVTIATGATAAGVTLVSIGTGNLSAAGNTTLNLATGNAPAGTTQAVNIGTGTGGGTKSVNIGSASDFLTSVVVDGVVTINPSSSTAATSIGNATAGGAVTIAGGTNGNVNVKNIQIAGSAGPSATVAATSNVRVGSVTLAGYTQAAAATLVITLTNSFIALGSVILASMTDASTNATLMTLSGIKPAAGSAVFTFTNNGSQAVNGNLQFNFWVLS